MQQSELFDRCPGTDTVTFMQEGFDSNDIEEAGEGAPQELLEIIRFSCKSGCSTGKCNCKQNGHTTLCGNCKGVVLIITHPDLVENENAHDEKQEPVTIYNK